MIGMTDKEFIICVKKIIFDECRDEQETVEDGFNIGVIDNEDLLENLESLISYYKDKSHD